MKREQRVQCRRTGAPRSGDIRGYRRLEEGPGVLGANTARGKAEGDLTLLQQHVRIERVSRRIELEIEPVKAVINQLGPGKTN